MFYGSVYLLTGPFWRASILDRLGEYAFSAALLAFSAIALSIRKFAQKVRKRYRENWPTVMGVITNCDVSVFHGRFTDHAIGILGYSYVVGGTYFSGYFKRQYFDEQAAWTFADSMRDQDVLIRHSPTQPSVSMIFERDLPDAMKFVKNK